MFHLEHFNRAFGAGVVFVCLAALTVSAQSQVTREVLLGDALRTAAVVKCQDGSFLLIRRPDLGRFPGDESPNAPDAQSVALLDAAGHEIFARQPGLDIPDLRLFSVHDAAVSKNGLLVVTGVAVSTSNEYAGVFMIYKLASGELVRIVRTDTVFSMRIAVDENSDIWSLGNDSPVAGTRSTRGQDYSLIHKFSSDGRLLGAYVPRHLFDPQLTNPKVWQSGKLGEPQIVSNKKGGIFALLPSAQTLLELDLEGNLVSRLRVSENGLGSRRGDDVAIQPNGTLLMLMRLQSAEKNQRGSIYAIHRLKTSSGDWEPFRLSSNSLAALLTDSRTGVDLMKHRYVIGADESNLIVRDYQTGKLIWIPVPNR